MLLALYATTITLQKVLLALFPLGWDTLEYRRLFNQSVLFYKFHNNLVNCQTPSPVKSTEKITSTHGISPTYLLPITGKCLSFQLFIFPKGY